MIIKSKFQPVVNLVSKIITAGGSTSYLLARKQGSSFTVNLF
jgi:hypothetical protein